MSDGERPKSSWQSWVRSTERVRSAAPDDLADDPAVDPAFEVAVDPAVEVADEPDRPLAADLSFEPIDGPLTPAGARRVAADDDLDDAEELADADADAGSWTTGWSDDDAGADDLEADDLDAVADLDDDDAVVELDAGFDDDADEDDDDQEGFGELLPTVPLLPSIAGRVEALSGVLRAISHRVDGLSASTDVYRATVVDRIDQFTETVLEQGRHTDQALDEYRRTTERTIAELRRRVAEQADGSKVLLARVEEIATDLTTLLEAGPATTDPALAAELAQLRASILELPAEAGPALDPAWVAQVDAALDAVARSQDATKQAVDGLADGHASTARRLDQLQGLVEVVVDTMPGSAEGSAADVAGALADLRAAVAALGAKVDRPAPAAAAPAPASAAAPIDVAALADGVVDRIDVAALADAVVDRIDLDALAMLVAEHLSATFEVVDEPAPPAEPAPARKPRKG